MPTEPGWPDARPKYEDKEAYRQWWLRNPLSTVWGHKQPDLYARFKREQELIAQGRSPEEAASSGANVTLDSLRRWGSTPGARRLPAPPAAWAATAIRCGCAASAPRPAHGRRRCPCPGLPPSCRPGPPPSGNIDVWSPPNHEDLPSDEVGPGGRRRSPLHCPVQVHRGPGTAATAATPMQVATTLPEAAGLAGRGLPLGAPLPPAAAAWRSHAALRAAPAGVGRPPRPRGVRPTHHQPQQAAAGGGAQEGGARPLLAPTWR